ncbi:hypothetical protein [Streptomyces sp. S3(2020)]|uniref:hypothetical protein n=1 Tax=Streptomyces sp. S3(2020) TaxID=2732044 RepID=UPI0019CFD18C|nr:hypothetical protein [Streptomyces sp. S3(2020)]
MRLLAVTAVQNGFHAQRAGHVFDGTDVGGPGMVLVEDSVIRDMDFTGAAPPEDATMSDSGPDGWLRPGLFGKVPRQARLAYDR